MLAVCPYCHTVFRIGAHELKAAHGQVQCGLCLALFNALENLHEEDQIPSLAGGLPKSEPERPEELDMPSLSGREREPLDTPALALAATDREWPVPLEARAFVLKPKELDEEMADSGGKRGHRIRSLWAAGALILAVGLAIQYTWFHGEAILDRYPELRPSLEKLCVLLGCELPIRRDLEAVRLLSRDVRPHPRYRDTLLVNATLVNEAEFTQPYPVLQLEFSDVSGTPLAARRFQPAEYLDKNIKIEEGMPPGLPVHIVLELQWLKQAPVSFEFKFL